MRRILGVALLVLIVARIAARAGLSPLTRYVVDGPSMEPAFSPGDRLLVNRLAYVLRPPAPGDVVVLRDPQRPRHLLLKRVGPAPRGEASRSHVHVLGDNAAASRDSRSFGPVPRELIVGRAWLRY